jgi:predicted nucleic acid-binding protein
MNICADAGFLIAIYGERDGYHTTASECFEEYFNRPGNTLILPWPVLYESVSTRMTRLARRIQRIEADFTSLRLKGQLSFLDDSPFREQALDECFQEAKSASRHYRSLSLVDRVIRALLSHTNTRIGAFATFNPRDFHDVCRRFRRTIIPEHP